MGSASRPHRRARSAKVLYKDSASEDEADENFSIAHQPISSDRVRKNLALKRVSRSQERAEVLQIQKAIEESLSGDKENVNAGRVSSDAVDGAKEVVDSEEEALNVPGCITIEASLQYPCAGPPQEASAESMSLVKGGKNQAVYDEVPVPSIEIVHEDEQSSRQGIEGAVNPKDIKSTRTVDANKKILKAVVEKDEDWSCEEDDDDDDDEVTDDESSDASEGLKYKRKRPVNSQQKGRKAAGPKGKEQKALTAQVKKPRSSRTVPEARAPLPAKKGIPSNGNPMKPSTQSKPPDSKGHNLTSTIFEASKNHAMDSKESNELGRRGALLKGCKTTIVEHQKSPSATLLNKASPLENGSCESSGILGFPAQSPTGLHRRVIGLSRRFKPPPLHPYLPKMEG